MFAEARKLSLFNTLEALDLVVNKFKLLADKYLSRGKRNFLAVVEYLRRYSCKTRGVSFCKMITMVNNLKISESTIHRIINRLVDLGLVIKHYTFDKNGSQLPTYYQLQNEIDWIQVVKKLENPVTRVVNATTGQEIDLAAIPNNTPNERGNDTPPYGDKSSQDKPFWAIPDRRSFLYSFKSSKKDNEYKEPFPFYNWLEGETIKKQELPDYLLR